MNRTVGAHRTADVRMRLSTMWIFVLFNYLYCDVLSAIDPPLLRQALAGEVGGMQASQGFFLAAAVLMEIPIAMVLLSRIMSDRANRWANLAAGMFMAGVQVITLAAGPRPTSYYVFFSAVEIGCTAFIAWYAWTRLSHSGSATHQHLPAPDRASPR